MPKTKLSRVEVRMTPEEKENLKRKAAEAHMTVSKFIIHLSQTKRVILKDDIAKLTVEISINRTQLKVVSEYLSEVVELQKKILSAMFSDEDHTLITLEKKIEKLTKSVDSIGGRKN